MRSKINFNVLIGNEIRINIRYKIETCDENAKKIGVRKLDLGGKGNCAKD